MTKIHEPLAEQETPAVPTCDRRREAAAAFERYDAHEVDGLRLLAVLGEVASSTPCTCSPTDTHRCAS